MYKPKKCEYDCCEVIFLPTTGNHKYCECCSKKSRKEKNKIRWKKRNRELNNYKEYVKFCKICGEEFTTHYKKKSYCGTAECEKKRVKINSINAEIKRNKNNRIQTQIRKQEKREDDLIRINTYFSKFNYKIVDDSGYDNSHVGVIKVKCPHDHEWHTTFHNFKNNNNRCMTCYTNNNYVSKPEQMIRDYFESHHQDIECIYNDRSIITPKELDFYFPNSKVAVEVCGLYWHSEGFSNTPRNYHYNKMMECYNKGVRLITVFEDEIYNNFDVVMSRILQAINNTKRRIYARECKVKCISTKEANKFFIKNHLQGKSTAEKIWGLFYSDELVSVCSIGKLIRKHTGLADVVELKRLCTLPNTHVVGAAGKLFSRVIKYAQKEGYVKIKSYCDMRYANIFNPVYEVLGFVLTGSTKYTPHYFKNGVRYRNYSLRKTPKERLTGKTEYELRREQGYDRIWDCGHRTYDYIIN